MVHSDQIASNGRTFDYTYLQLNTTVLQYIKHEIKTITVACA